MLKTLLLAAGFALAGCSKTKEIPEGNLVYFALGDSITAGEKNTPGNTPGDYAVRALAGPATLIKLGFPGENAGQFLQSHRQQFLDSLAIVPTGHPLMLGLWYGANDLNAAPKEQALKNILRVARWARDTAHVQKVLLIPVMNRTDKFGFTREGDGSESHHFNESRLWLNARLRAEIASIPGVRMANESDAPAMYADTYPANKVLCADEVHPLDAGAKEVGEGTIAKGIASFGDVKLK